VLIPPTCDLTISIVLCTVPRSFFFFVFILLCVVFGILSPPNRRGFPQEKGHPSFPLHLRRDLGGVFHRPSLLFPPPFGPSNFFPFYKNFPNISLFIHSLVKTSGHVLNSPLGQAHPSPIPSVGGYPFFFPFPYVVAPMESAFLLLSFAYLMIESFFDGWLFLRFYFFLFPFPPNFLLEMPEIFFPPVNTRAFAVFPPRK